jgi:hypothetical protein
MSLILKTPRIVNTENGPIRTRLWKNSKKKIGMENMPCEIHAVALTTYIKLIKKMI